MKVILCALNKPRLPGANLHFSLFMLTSTAGTSTDYIYSIILLCHHRQHFNKVYILQICSTHLYAPDIDVVSTRLTRKQCLGRYITARLGGYKTRILPRSAYFCKETVHNIFSALALDQLHAHLQGTVTASPVLRCHLPSPHHKGEPADASPQGSCSQRPA